MRMVVKKMGGVTVISDIYNANPASMEEARELMRLRGSRAVAVLGDMLELGSYSREAHDRLVELLVRLGIDVLVAVGPEMTEASAKFPKACFNARNSVDPDNPFGHTQAWRHGSCEGIKGNENGNGAG